MTLFLLKLFSVPLLTAGVTLVGRRWGEEQGGKLASLPWVAGPISFLIAIEQGEEFAAKAAIGSMVAVAGLAAFCVVYIWAGKRFHYLLTLLLAYIAYGLVACIGIWLPLNALPIYLGTMISIVLMVWITPPISKPSVKGKARAFVIPMRMVISALFVMGLTKVAAWLGPTWSGVLTPFPILTSVLAVFTHWQRGIQSASFLLQTLTTGLTGFASFLFVVGIGLPVLGIGLAYFLAAITSFGISWSTYALVNRFGRKSSEVLECAK